MDLRLIRTVLCALLLASASPFAAAQVLYGTLTGNVTDPAGAAVPNAHVEALDQDTNVKSEATTDERGIYRFTDLQAGPYKVTVAANSFRTFIETNVPVQTNEIRRVDVQLQIATTSESVVVSADAVVLQTDKADIRSEVTSQEVEELPYNGSEGKNFQALLLLQPGAVTTAGNGEANSAAGNPQRAITVFMNGVSSQANNTRLDGALNAYPWLPVNVAYVPSPESIQTVTVSTNAFDAEQGAAGGAAVNVSIKTGTNDLHGVLFERNTNQDFDAVNNYFSHPGRLAKNIQNQFGFAVGGPVWIPKIVHGRNKLFWFMSWEDTKQSQFASDANLTLPTAAMRTGDFSAAPTTIYDPLTGNPDGTGRTPFAGNIIPGNRIASASATLTSLLPALTRPNSFYTNYDAYGATTYTVNRWDWKANYNPSDKAMIWGRYSISPMDIYAPLVLGPAGGDAFNGGNPGHAGGRVQVTAAGLTYTFTPTLLFDGNVGYTRQNIGANGDPQDGDYGTDVLHIPGTNGTGPNYEGIPGFQVSGLANIGNTNTGSPFQFRDNQYATNVNLTKIKGSHNIRVGFEYDKFALNHFQPQGGTFGTARGTFGFDGSLTALKGGAAINAGSPSNSWAQFLLGFPSETGKVTQFTNPIGLRFSTWSTYARDVWQVSSRLTIDYGLRWEYYPIYSHDHYGAVRFDPATDYIYVGGEGGVPWDAGATANKKDFAPRLGAAYRLSEKTVIRSGFGITIDPDNMRNQRNQYPAIVNQVYQPLNTYQFVSYAGVPNSDGAAQVQLKDGIPLPTFPNISVGIIKPSPTASLTTYLPSTSTVTFPANFDRGYYETWNFFIQHEFSSSLVAQAGYVGTHGVHVNENININGSLPGTGTAGRQLYPYITSDMNSISPFGSMTYNGLQMSVRKRIGASLIGANYTFSRAIDNSNGDNGDGFLWRAYPASYTLDKQLSGISRSQVFNLFVVYQLPFGKGHTMATHGLANWIFGGWQISSILNRFSGLPFSVGTTASINAGGQGTSADSISPNVKILGGHDANTPYFDGTAFINPPNNTFGTLGRDTLRGPGLFALNGSISRKFNFKEGRISFQLVGEAFNLTNSPVFSNPNATCNQSYPTATSCWTTNSNGSPNFNGFGTISNTVSSPRSLQVGGYLRF
ncbi:MAG TPA: TonB-dependent receptor [Bryobacteraceae bacterium]|nr:TonB-dependent receptor [Bryobacteraceae bacterium]